MESFLIVVAVNAVTATVLALAVAAASRGIRRPGILHMMWLIVLADLVTPPMLPVGVVPRLASPPIATAASEIGSEKPDAVALPAGPRDSAGVLPRGLTATPSGIVLTIWLTVSFGVILLALRRTMSFRRLLDATTPAGAELRRSAESIARRLGLARLPVIRIVPARIPPMLLSRLGAPELLLPEGLLSQLEPDERDAVIAHELAHVRRRDHWVRFLELAAVAGFWWHPVVWWARSALRRYEERCCDDLVLQTLPGHARHYADSLVKTVEFLSRGGANVPALASGIRRTRDLEERLVMIMKRRLPTGISRPQRMALALAAASLLVLFPTWADRDDRGPDGDASDASSVELAQIADRVREQSLSLEREALELETRLHEIRSMQAELEESLEVRRSELETLELEQQAARREDQGLAHQADELRASAERLRRQVELEREMRQLERDQRSQAVERQAEIREIMLEVAAAEARGERESAAELKAKAESLAQDIELEVHAGLLHGGEFEQARSREALRELHAELDRQRARMHADSATESAEAEIALARLYAEMARAEAERRVLQLDKLRATAEELDADGSQDEADAIRRRIDELERARQRELGGIR